MDGIPTLKKIMENRRKSGKKGNFHKIRDSLDFGKNSSPRMTLYGKKIINTRS